MKHKLRIIFIALFTFLSSQYVWAGANPTAQNDIIIQDKIYLLHSEEPNPNELFEGRENRYWIPISSIPQNAKEIKVSSSKPEVASIRRVRQPQSAIQVQTKGIGETELSISWVTDASSCSTNIPVCVQKYSNPFKSLKLGKTEYKGIFKYGAGDYLTHKKNGKYKLTCSLKKGWKIKELSQTTSEGGNGASSTHEMIKNNSYININTRKAQVITLSLVNKHNKTVQIFNIEFY